MNAVLCALVLAAAPAPLRDYLAAPAEVWRKARPLPEGRAIVCRGGMHKGHKVLETALPTLQGKARWRVRYNVCLDRAAHPGLIEVWPREGMSGIGLPATRANWYGGGCLDVLIDGQSVGPYRARFRYAKGERPAVMASWKTPMGDAELAFSCAPGDPRLLIEGRVRPAAPRAPVLVRLRCFPAAFQPPRKRFVVTAKRTLSAPSRAVLAPGEFWLFYGDKAHDAASDPKSAGPCGLMYDPAEMRRVVVRVARYPVETELYLKPRVRAFHLALWVFPKQSNARALAALRAAAAGVIAPTAATRVVKAPPRTLALRGEPAAVIVVPATAPALTQHAAQELSEFLFEMSGATLPIAAECEKPGVNRIVLADARTAAALGAPIDAAALGREGFRLKTAGRDVVIAGGGPAGVLFGAYELLERLGWRCYVEDPLGIVAPKKETIRLPELDVTDRPDFPMRWVAWGEHSFRIRGNAGRRGLPPGFDIQPSVYHAMYRYLNPKDYFETHPEWFALSGGRRKLHNDAKPCTSNPEVALVVAGAMRKLIGEHPHADLVSLAFKDGSSYCECPRCRALDEEGVPRDQSFSRRALLFYNAVAERVSRTNPGVRILAGAYHVYNRPPRDASLAAHPALSLVLCHYTSYCLLHPVTDPTCPRNAEYRKLLLAWKKRVRDVYFYEYYYTDGWCGLPCPLVHVVRKDIPYFHRLGCKGLYTQYGSVWNTFLTDYVASRLLWRADTDVDALLEDFYAKFFAAAKAPMRRYFEALERAAASSKEHLCTCSMCSRDPRFLFSDALMAELRAHLRDARALAKDPLVCARLEKFQTALDYTERYRQFWAKVTAARKESDRSRRAALAEAAVADLAALRGDVRAHPARYRGIVTPHSYHWRYAERAARNLLPRKRRLLRFGKTLMRLPKQWRFALDKKDVGLRRGWYKADFDDSRWASIESGRHWEDQGYAGYDGIAWYRTTFRLTRDQLAGPLALAFAGVDAEATVFLNGERIGAHKGWNDPFLVRLPAAAAREGANALAVRVVDTAARGGMYGDVTLARPGR